MLIPILALALMSLNAPASESATGSTLFHECQAWIRYADGSSKTGDDFSLGEYCIGYVEGFTSGLLWSDAFHNVSGLVCPPESSTFGTAVRIYVAYMEKHPKLMDENKYIGLFDSLRDAYPCSKKGR